MISLKDWQNLLTYYITCLEKETSSESTFEAKTEGYVFETNFLKEETLFSKGHKETTIPLTERLNRFLNKTFSDNRSNKLYYAYPFVKFSDGSIIPAFISEVSFNIDEENKTLTLTCNNTLPEFSYSLLLKDDMVREEIYQKLHEIDSFQRENDQKTPKNDRFIQLLKCAFNQTRFENDYEIDTNSLVSVDLNTEGVLNQALLYWGKGNPYTKNLIQELNELIKPIYYEQLEKTSLRYLFDEKVEENEKGPRFVFSVLPLNSSQKKAIRKGLTDSFTVVTGPPGTGKSQVLVNLVINALVNDRSVLFASNNNKAVNVVYERLDKLTDESYVVRTGNREFRAEAFETLAKKAEKIKYGKNHNKFLRYKNDAIQSIETINKLNIKISRRKELKRKIFLLKKNITKQENSYDWFKNNHELKIINKEKLILLKEKFERLSSNKRTIFELLNDLLSNKKTKVKFIDIFYQYLKENGFGFIEIKYFGKIGSILQELDIFKDYKKNLKELNILNKKLNKIPLLKELQKSLNECNKFLYNISLSLYEDKWLYNLESSSPSQAVVLQDFIKVQQRLNSNVRLGGEFYRLKERAMSLMTKLIEILPIWGVTNLSAKDSIPLSGGLFDLVVLDEASQCDIPSSIPLLFRAKRMMIIGDDKQLTHISIIPERKDKNYFDDSNVNLDWDIYSYVKQSLFKIADRQYSLNDKKTLILKDHYRCHPEIINFSNKEFYGETLEVLTNTDNFKVENPGMFWLDLKGNGKRVGAGNIYNLIEATKSAEIMAEIIEKHGNSLSYGIISPYRKQTGIIREKILTILNKKSTDELKSIDLIIGTAHAFQGDEKDVVIFSPVVSEGMPEGTINFVNENINLLNVAVTRAKQKLIIVGDLDFALKKNGLLKKLANYVINLDHVINL